jgi:hypothetical protein
MTANPSFTIKNSKVIGAIHPYHAGDQPSPTIIKKPLAVVGRIMEAFHFTYSVPLLAHTRERP